MDSFSKVQEGYPSFGEAWRTYIMPHSRATVAGKRGNYFLQTLNGGYATFITPSGKKKHINFHPFQSVYNLLLESDGDLTRSDICAHGIKGCFDEICLLFPYIPFIQMIDKTTPRLHLLPADTPFPPGKFRTD